MRHSRLQPCGLDRRIKAEKGQQGGDRQADGKHQQKETAGEEFHRQRQQRDDQPLHPGIHA
ncbi:hypothetical protein [Microvirgula sp. AG722]|uniref:hypothetical protein n=1 Tax=Microvirgula sp. AG722 TaxID=2183901 RepID=UPI000DD85E3E|nr:hypothetical protein [Microvirgula sp. AG722]